MVRIATAAALVSTAGTYVSAFSPVSPFTRGLSTVTSSAGSGNVSTHGSGCPCGSCSQARHGASCKCASCARVAHSVRLCGSWNFSCILHCFALKLTFTFASDIYVFERESLIWSLCAHAHHVSNLTPPLANALHAPAHTLLTALVRLVQMFTLPSANVLLALVHIPKNAVALYAVECREWNMFSSKSD